MMNEKRIRELAAREAEALRARELLQQALAAATAAGTMMGEQSAEAHHSIEDAADALRAATQVVQHCRRADGEELRALGADERAAFEAARDAVLRRLSHRPQCAHN